MFQKKIFFIFIVFIMTLVLPWIVFSATSKKVTKKETIVTKPIKILLVPGHDDEFSGTQYGNLKEASMNRVLAEKIFNNLKKDKRFSVSITRNANGYTKTFDDFLNKKYAEIVAFKENAKKDTQTKINSGDFAVKQGVPHVSVNKIIANRLYGINKWVNDNNVDAVIHIHFNDSGRDSFGQIGMYKGFSIYYPDETLLNATESKKLGEKIFDQLKKKYSPSNYEKENGGLVADQSLIAMGANKSLNKDVKSVLIEYGYIYEKFLRNPKTRRQAYVSMADLTASGIKGYFFPSKK